MSTGKSLLAKAEEIDAQIKRPARAMSSGLRHAAAVLHRAMRNALASGSCSRAASGALEKRWGRREGWSGRAGGDTRGGSGDGCIRPKPPHSNVNSDLR